MEKTITLSPWKPISPGTPALPWSPWVYITRELKQATATAKMPRLMLRRCFVQQKSQHQLHSKLNCWQAADHIECKNNPEQSMYFSTWFYGEKGNCRRAKTRNSQALCIYRSCKKRDHTPLANSNHEGGEVLNSAEQKSSVFNELTFSLTRPYRKENNPQGFCEHILVLTSNINPLP